MCNCCYCEMLIDNEPVKVVDFKANSPFANDIFHFEDGFRCTYNGSVSTSIEDLPENGCRCTGGDE